MSNLNLTNQESAAFYQDITRNLALDYFYVFDNVPLQFVYRDRLNTGESTVLETRNRVITETVWMEAYHQYLVSNVVFLFTYRGGVLQMPLQLHQIGAGIFKPPAEDSSRVYATAEGLQVNFDEWMASKGWKMADDMRHKTPRASWQTLLGIPDRTVRIVSIMPVGNQVLLELITTWTEEGVLKETAWVVVLIYDVDGTVLQDRSYIEMSNWPSVRKNAPSSLLTPQEQPKSMNVMDGFFDYHRSRQSDVANSKLEKRNLAIIEGAWVDDQNTCLDPKLFHPARFRMQLPLQKCSCNLHIAREITALVKQVAPDRKMRLGMTYAKGSQVVAEGIVSWLEDGVDKEAPFISFLLLDKDGLVIRDRCYFTMDNWPGADKVKARLGL